MVIVEWLCIVYKKWDTNLPSWSYDNHVGVIKMNEPSLLIGQSRYTVNFLMFNNPVLFYLRRSQPPSMSMCGYVWLPQHVRLVVDYYDNPSDRLSTELVDWSTHSHCLLL